MGVLPTIAHIMGIFDNACSRKVCKPLQTKNSSKREIEIAKTDWLKVTNDDTAIKQNILRKLCMFSARGTIYLPAT